MQFIWLGVCSISSTANVRRRACRANLQHTRSVLKHVRNFGVLALRERALAWRRPRNESRQAFRVAVHSAACADSTAHIRCLTLSRQLDDRLRATGRRDERKVRVDLRSSCNDNLPSCCPAVFTSRVQHEEWRCSTPCLSRKPSTLDVTVSEQFIYSRRRPDRSRSLGWRAVSRSDLQPDRCVFIIAQISRELPGRPIVGKTTRYYQVKRISAVPLSP